MLFGRSLLCVPGKQKICPLLQRRFLAVYTIGDGWTGALGTGSLDSFAAGHNDEDESDAPFLIYDGPVSAASAGWGHTTFTSNGSLFVTGRTHDLPTLLRLRRLPHFLRMYAVNSIIEKHREDANDNIEHFPSFSDTILSMLVQNDKEREEGWKLEKRLSVSSSPTVVDLPAGHRTMIAPSACEYSLDASAGLTALISQNGKVLSFGNNHYGQCGIGASSENVWSPTVLADLSSEFLHGDDLAEGDSITQVALGLQHGLALTSQGEIYAWGKGERGQLGIRGLTEDYSPVPKKVSHFRLPSEDGMQNWSDDAFITGISAGLNHSAARTNNNVVYVWGKNVAQPRDQKKIGQDSQTPIQVRGLPGNKDVLKVSCGSHHTAILLEDGSVYGFGLTADTAEPIFEAVMIMPAGSLDMPVQQFKSHFDRTTIIGKNGGQVIQLQFWSDSSLREHSAFTPAWIDHFSEPIKYVHRGWLHTVIVT
eukprot:CAMPEP_0194260122 /NCGR_PEP_ID=MMETSP0158-20130606/45234_1 /TAXON_ID=33649 /ORGANISM="Thalassionema nitzschioides, Strain L26-B" /LENGTH=478 /DNA_ID=CAMNT_0039000181 /DNA_START=234 /DNA_END=1670 /DNA_ORIENTATION=+